MASYELEGYYFYNSLDSRFSAPYGNAYGDWYKFKATIPENSLTPEYDSHFGKIYSFTHSGDSFYSGSGAYELTKRRKSSYGSSYLSSFDVTQYYDKETDSLFTDYGEYAYNGITQSITTLSGYGGLGGESGYIDGTRFSPSQEWDEPYSYTYIPPTPTPTPTPTPAPTPAPAPTSSSDSSVNKIYGNKKGNKLKGTNNDDYMDGGKGDDTIFGLNGDDIIIGGKGQDIIYTGDGEDMIAMSKKLSRGRSFDEVIDFAKGEDYLYIEDRKNKWY
ncbi:hypothetical protein N9R98_00750, partial [bacterium]|nr:hypothetical protein [bacterium]